MTLEERQRNTVYSYTKSYYSDMRGAWRNYELARGNIQLFMDQAIAAAKWEAWMHALDLTMDRAELEALTEWVKRVYEEAHQ